MEKNIEHIIKTKSYIDLSTGDLMLVQDWASNEEEFDALKRTLLAAEGLQEEASVEPKIREDLTALFREKYGQPAAPKKSPLFSLRSQGESNYLVFKIAAILVVALLTIPLFFVDKPIQEPEILTSKNEEKSTQKLMDTNQQQSQMMPQRQKQLITESEVSTSASKERRLDADVSYGMADEELIEKVNINSGEGTYSFTNTAPAFSMTTAKDSYQDSRFQADILTKSDVLPKHKEVAQSKPQVLDVLFTVF